MRPFNRDAADKVNAVCKEEGKKAIERVEGQKRVEMFADHCNSMNLRAERARLAVGPSQCALLTKYLEGDTNRSSRVDLEERKEKYAEGINKKRKITKSEQNSCGADVPAKMDGGITIRNLQVKYDTQIKAEIIFRGIKLDKLYKDLKHKEKVDYLRLDEMKNLVAQGKARDGIKPGDVKYIVPCSAEMVALVTAINRNE